MYVSFQSSLDRLTHELSSEQERLRTQQESESRLRHSEEHLQVQLKKRSEQVHELELKLKAVRHEADAQLQTTVSRMLLKSRQTVLLIIRSCVDFLYRSAAWRRRVASSSNAS